ncbi:predicted protein [Coccidioides posadasii str. Silveira]|uniref:Predicted protein n=2 Tax=Coccidioides posadasii TaxID=199306 RepID=E9D035_COCPS|nr:predicted protein [Coccidioides posadasii str. Silveira]KMM73149.1 hypothetical protein CPAG_09438 [Coccidioides posadasii RMSCC 3488]
MASAVERKHGVYSQRISSSGGLNGSIYGSEMSPIYILIRFYRCFLDDDYYSVFLAFALMVKQSIRENNKHIEDFGAWRNFVGYQQTPISSSLTIFRGISNIPERSGSPFAPPALIPSPNSFQEHLKTAGKENVPFRTLASPRNGTLRA